MKVEEFHKKLEAYGITPAESAAAIMRLIQKVSGVEDAKEVCSFGCVYLTQMLAAAIYHSTASEEGFKRSIQVMSTLLLAAEYPKDEE